MAEFDPDAYLATPKADAFDPDAYLASGKKAPKTTIAQDVKQSAGNLVAGAVRGAGSIGATLLAPWDIAKDAMAGKGLSLESNRERRAAMDEALGNMGAETDSFGYGAGKLAGEIAGTAGAGGLLARGAAPVLQAVAPRIATPLTNAIASGGMSTGSRVAMGPAALSRGADIATRAAGGAIAGGLTAGLVNPQDAGAGAVVGGALPPAMMLAGGVGRSIGRAVRGPAPTPELLAAAQQARATGYVIPPTQVQPTLTNRLLEGFSGKLTTAQNASARNQTVTNRLAAETLGLPGDVPITPDTLNVVRRQAGQAYNAIGNAGVITPGQAYTQALDRIVAPYQQAAQGFPNAAPSPVIDAINSLRSPSFDAASAVSQLRNVREMADTAFAQGNRGVGRSLRQGAEALESAVEDHLQQTGQAQLLNEFRDARRLIAQTYSIEKALNPVTGTVDARKLASQVAKGRPMTGPVRDAAEFAARFPKAAQPLEGMGSLPQTSPLDWAAFGGIGAATANPLAMLGVAARPMARAAVLSGPVQNRLANPQTQNQLVELLSSPEGQQLLYRLAPQAATSR